jgi:hypothetical protein
MRDGRVVAIYSSLTSRDRDPFETFTLAFIMVFNIMVFNIKISLVCFLEKVLSGSGCDAYVLSALVEADETDDVMMIEKRTNEGLLSLARSTHLARTATVWSNNKDKDNKDKDLEKTQNTFTR